MPGTELCADIGIHHQLTLKAHSALQGPEASEQALPGTLISARPILPIPCQIILE